MANSIEKVINFSDVAAKSPEGNTAYIKIGETLSLSSNDYQGKIFLHAGSREKAASDAKTRVEITDSKAESLPKDSYIDVEIAPQDSGKYSFKIYNPYPKVSLSFWIQGNEVRIPAGDKFEVLAKSQSNYSPFVSGEMGTFYAMIGQNQYAKFYMNDQGQTFVKTNEITKSGLDISRPLFAGEEDKEDNTDVDVVWSTEPLEKGGALSSIVFGSGDTSQVKIDEKGVSPEHIKVGVVSPHDDASKVTIKAFRGSKFWTKAENDGKTQSYSGEETLLPFTYFGIGNKVYFYVGIRGAQLKILEVKR